MLYVFTYTICLCKQAGPIYSILDRARSNIILNPEIDLHWIPVLHFINKQRCLLTCSLRILVLCLVLKECIGLT